MQYTLAFDVYGTLINTSGVLNSVQAMIGDTAPAFIKTWRDKQLEYSFRRAAMDRFVDFSVCTKAALNYACLLHQVEIDAPQRQALMDEYKVLPCFPEVKAALNKFKSQGHQVYAFSNGSYKAIEGLLSNAGVADIMDGMISVEKVQMFKPNPKVYQHFIESTHSQKENSWLISGNPFDVLGALSYGMKAAWIKRSPHSLFDPWELEPNQIASTLLDLEFG